MFNLNTFAKKRITDNIINTVSVNHIFLRLNCLTADLSKSKIVNIISAKPIIKTWLKDVQTPNRMYIIYNITDNGENIKSGVILIFFIIFYLLVSLLDCTK